MQVTHEEFEHAVQRVSADMAEGRTVIETADNAQKKTRTSLANHNLTAHNAASVSDWNRNYFFALTICSVRAPATTGRE